MAGGGPDQAVAFGIEEDAGDDEHGYEGYPEENDYMLLPFR
jgi:hypothetical protein